MFSPIRFQLPDGPFASIQILSEHTFRISMNTNSRLSEPPLVRYGIFASGGTAPAVAVDENSRQLTVSTRHAILTADKRDGTIVFSRPDGVVLTCSAAPPRLDSAGGFEAQLRVADGEKLYGLGDKVKDRLELNGVCAEMRTVIDDTQVPIPFLMSSKGWALLIGTTWAHTVDICSTFHDRLRFSAPAGRLDYYLIAGDDYAALLDRYTDLTGKPSLLPIWAYGLTYIANQYANARDIIEDGLNFRRENIPCDMIGLEPGWMATYRDYTTSRNWHPERFAIPAWNPKGPRTFLGALDRMGIKLSLWLCCRYDITREEERPLAALTETGAEEETEEAWYDHLKKFVDQGVSAFKLEGYYFDDHSDLLWANGLCSGEMHNLYHLLLCKQMHQGFANQTGRRPMIYSMNGYAGIQQYAATWTGYQHESLIGLLNQSMSGNVNALTDMDVHTPAGIHFGFLQTLSQVNSWAYWQHPSLLEPGQIRMFRLYAQLRYRLLPYLYSAAHTATRTGMPIMRSMPLVYPLDPKSDELLEQYMLGDSLLVALKERVYLPEGDWIDYWTGTCFTGPREFEYDIPPHVGGPLFVRAGAIIPVWPEMSHIVPGVPERIGLHLYPCGESGEYTLYEDDGVSYAYKEGGVAETNIRFHTERDKLVVRISPRVGTFTGMPAVRLYDVTIHAVEVMPSILKLSGTALPFCPPVSGEGAAAAEGWHYDRTAREVRLRVQEDVSGRHPVHIEVHFGAASEGGSTPKPGTIRDTYVSANESSVNTLVRQVIAHLDDESGKSRTLHTIAEKLHVNSSHLSRLFKRETGISFSAYALRHKMERAKQLLHENRKIGDVADLLGFTDASHFIRVFRKYWGVTPGKIKLRDPRDTK